MKTKWLSSDDRLQEISTRSQDPLGRRPHDRSMAPHNHTTTATPPHSWRRREKPGGAEHPTGRASTSTTPSTCSSPYSPASAWAMECRSSTWPADRGWPFGSPTEWVPMSGIDAAAELVDVACQRTPAAGSASRIDVRVALGRWTLRRRPVGERHLGWLGAALDEAHRVLRPGGLIGISFWGQGPPLPSVKYSRSSRFTHPSSTGVR